MMARGRGKKRKSGGFNASRLDKKQKSHLQEFGEAHPADERNTEKIRYKKVTDEEQQYEETQSTSEESESEEETAYVKLVSTLTSGHANKINQVESDNEGSDSGEDKNVEQEKTEEGEIRGSESDSGEESRESEDEEQGDADYRDEEYQADEEEGKEEDGFLHEKDPFHLHFEQDLPDELADRIKGSKQMHKEEIKVPLVGRCTLSWPEHANKLKPAFKESNLRKLQVKQTLCNQTADVNKEKVHVQLKGKDSLTPLQLSLFSVMNNYQDIYYPERSHKNSEELRLVYCLHALNHVLKTRDRVISHNTKIKSKKEDVPDDYRDQGLTRPKVLMVLPFRDSALKVVDIMCKLLMKDEQSFVSNKKRFWKEYGEEEKSDAKGQKAEDFEAMFHGNTDDHFRVGLGVAKKSLKIYTKFYQSDIILASPLGLRTIIGAEGEEERDYDFLSSIEVLIFDQTDVFLMQNWDHIMHLMSHLHLQPQEGHGVDFSRVRMWTLNGWSNLYRQTIILSSIATPEINGLINKHCQNYAGKVVMPKLYASGAICQIVTQLPQVFQRVAVTSYTHASEALFKHFTEKVLPEHKDVVMKRTLIFVSSYFDFVRLRNYLVKEEVDFGQMCEYTKPGRITRARSHFYHGRSHFLVYTERLHFYRRFRIRGVKHIIFYQLPLYGQFYSELCNMLQNPKNSKDSSEFTCTVMYTKYDAQRLSGVVGTDKAAHMISSDKDVHMFVTEET